MSIEWYRKINIALNFHYPHTKVDLFTVINLLNSHDLGTKIGVDLYAAITPLTSHDPSTRVDLYFVITPLTSLDITSRVDLYSTITPLMPYEDCGN